MRTADPEVLRRILDSAMQLFGERPFHQVRMDEIATHAKSSKGSIYSRFNSKEELYLGLIVHFGKQLRDDIQSRTSRCEAPCERLLVLIQQVFNFHDRYPYFLELIQRAEVVCRGSEQLAANRRGFVTLISETLESIDPAAEATTLELSSVALMGITRAILQITPAPRSDKLPKWVIDRFLLGFCPNKRDGGDYSKPIH